MTSPETRYATAPDGVHIAYQAAGTAPLDLLLVDTWVHHVEAVWDFPDYARLLRRLMNFARVIHFDRRGTGLSDPVPLDRLPDLEVQVDDAIAVLDAAGAARPAVIGVNDGGAVAIMLAAGHPERCGSLVLFTPTARHSREAGTPMEDVDAAIEQITTNAVAGQTNIELLAPSRRGDQRFAEHMARFQRASVRPGAIGHYFRQTMTSDVTDLLPRIQAPTLLLNRTGNRMVAVAGSREAADLIPEGTFVELPGTDHLIFSEGLDALVGEIEEFLTGVRSGVDPERTLSTLVFTDIVNSTRRAAEFGDRRWRDLLDEHDAVVRRELERFGGREVATTGDGFLARFGSPAGAVRCAVSIAQAMAPLGLRIRAGVHTGEVELRGDDVGGLAVHIAARVAALAGPDEVLVSSTVKDLLVGSGIELSDRGEHELKGVPDRWRLYAVKRPGD